MVPRAIVQHDFRMRMLRELSSLPQVQPFRGLAEDVISAAAMDAEAALFHHLLRRAPLVLANILAPVIIRLFEDGLGELPSPGGKLVLSGILFEQAAAVRQAAEAKGLQFVEQVQQGDWVALVFNRA